MKWLNAGMREQYVVEFIDWLKQNGIMVGEPFEIYGIWKVPYMPIGREQKEMCEQYIEYCCNNDLL